ncbi:hypothetical protein H5410_058630 [Solanum commersonii]|uniref:Uncharacterized protein n=1 Tax=Solanum commersonii TaxID=4109 RepID=A0A9J5WU25_SOLCO|nr:hypothetical protein H5410_058630 [Solanum commersonii]
MPSALRQLFAMLLIYCNPTNPRELWERFESPMLTYIILFLAIVPWNGKSFYTACFISYNKTQGIYSFSNRKFCVAFTSSLRSNRSFSI